MIPPFFLTLVRVTCLPRHKIYSMRLNSNTKVTILHENLEWYLGENTILTIALAIRRCSFLYNKMQNMLHED